MATPTTWSGLKALNRERGEYWFDPDNMRFFACRLARDFRISDCRRYAVFATSEKAPHQARRLYSVRIMALTGDERGSVETAFAFQNFASSAAADRASRKVTAALPNTAFASLGELVSTCFPKDGAA